MKNVKRVQNTFLYIAVIDYQKRLEKTVCLSKSFVLWKLAEIQKF